MKNQSAKKYNLTQGVVIFMKKDFAALIMAFCITLTGCNSVSQDEYDSVVSLNSELQSKNEQLETELKEVKESLESAEELVEQVRIAAQNVLSQNEQSTTNSQQQETSTSEAEITGDYIDYVTPNGLHWIIYDSTAIRKCFVVIDTTRFAGYNDEFIINTVYDIVEDFAFSYENDASISYLYVLNANGDVIAFTGMTIAGPSEDGITWFGEYEKYNDHPTNISCAKDFSNYGGSKSDITIDNYSIHFSGEYDFVSVETAGGSIDSYLSQSESNASELIALDVEVVNNTISKRNFEPSPNMFIFIIDPNGKLIDDCSSCFDDGIDRAEIPSKGGVSKRFYLPYEGDGEYTFEFIENGDIFGAKQVYIIEVSKP